jgi:hypothetical protein
MALLVIWMPQCDHLSLKDADRNYTAMHTHVQWSVHLSALLIT